MDHGYRLFRPVAVADKHVRNKARADDEGVPKRGSPARIGRTRGVIGDPPIRIGHSDAVLPGLRPAEIHAVLRGARPIDAKIVAIDCGDTLARAEPIVALGEARPRPVWLRVEGQDLRPDAVPPV